MKAFGKPFQLLTFCLNDLLLFLQGTIAYLLGFFISFVITFDLGHPGIVQNKGVIRDIIKKDLIMRDNNKSSVVIGQIAFQPNSGLQIQVIGRLIEQDQIILIRQHPGQLGAHLPSTGKMGNGFMEICFFKT